MKNKQYIYILMMVISFGLFTSCTDDLNQTPVAQVTSASVYANAANYKSVMAKAYASLAIAGQEKGDGNTDLGGKTSNGYLRIYFNLQELPTDEAIYTWAGGDALTKIQYIKWDATDEWVSGMYYRIYYTVALCNEFLRNATDDKIAKFSATEIADIKSYRAEVRFLRALVYSHALDMFGNVPFVTESDPVGAFFPPRKTRAELFTYVESELKAISEELPLPKANEYGRASRAASWSLLAKLYLNAKVYTGTDRNTDCITYASKVIAGGYSLEPTYKKLFNADNDKRTNEIIFPIEADGQHTTTWGSTTYLVCGQIVGSMVASDYGVQTGWGSIRTRKQFVNQFTDITGATDKRASFYTNGQTLDILDPSLKTDGYAIIKFTNKTDAGANGSNYADGLVDTDFPMIRLADVYLMYAEAVVRGGLGGNIGTAVNYVNLIRNRAYGNASGNIAQSDLTLDFLLAERGRELYWECTRRTDLIRFGKFTGSSYVWQWKGGVKDGMTVDSKYNLFPIPAADLAANPNLIQNEGFNN